jgi:hypothetical protein
MSSPKTLPPPVGSWSELTRSIVSLLVIVHFCCVFVVLASAFRRSPMQEQLVSFVFARYTKGLAFDPGTIRYYHTLGREEDDDAVLLVDLYPDSERPITGQTLIKTVSLPADESPWLESRRRYLALAKIIQVNEPEGGEADPEQPTRDETAAEVAKAVGRAIIVENRLESGKLPRAVVRCVRRMSQPQNLAELNAGFPPDPTAAAYNITLYTADVWIDEDGQTVIVKRAARNEQAPLQGSTSSS